MVASTPSNRILDCELLGCAGFDLMPLPPRAAKQIVGCNRYVLDCQWCGSICRKVHFLASFGLPTGFARFATARQSKRLNEDSLRYVQRMRTACAEMNARLHSVNSIIADVKGVESPAVNRRRRTLPALSRVALRQTDRDLR